MSKRPGKGGPAPPPPLPPGPVPDQATVNAAWAQYYAQQGMVAQAAQTPVTPVSAPAGSSAYSNYGYGPGANMPGQAPMGAANGMNMHMGAQAAGGPVYGRPQNQQIGMNMGMNMGHAGQGMPMGGGGVGMQGAGAGAMGMGMGMHGQTAYAQPQGQARYVAPAQQPQYAAPVQPQYAGMYAPQQPVPGQQQPGAYGMQAMPTYAQPQQPMNVGPTAGPTRPYRPPPPQAQGQQPYGAPGPYSSIQPAGPMTPMGPAQPGANFQGNMGGRRPGGPGPSSGGPGGFANGTNGNFPPAKRPRMEGPPANRMGAPGPMSGPSPSGPRSAPAGMAGSGRRGPTSDYGGSTDGGIRPPSINGPPRGSSSRGRGLSSANAITPRGVPGAGRGRGGSFASGPSDAGSIRGSPRSTRGTGHGAAAPSSSSYRGRGGKFPSSSTSSAPSGSGAPRAPRNGARGTAPGRGGHPSSRSGESSGNHRQYAGSSTGSKTAPQAPSGPGQKRRASTSGPNPARTGGKTHAAQDSESAAYQEERTRVAREEARKRTMTDFRIIGLEIKQLGWKWGSVRDLEAEEFEGDETDSGDSEEEETEGDATQDKPVAIDRKQESKQSEESVAKPAETPTSKMKVKLEAEDSGQTDKATHAKPAKTKQTVKAENTVHDDTKPEAIEDDARIIAKKRNTHGPANRMLEASTTTPASAPEKNRFRIYFASPVERGDGISLHEYLAGKTEYDVGVEEQEEVEGNVDDEEQDGGEDVEETAVPEDEDELLEDENQEAKAAEEEAAEQNEHSGDAVAEDGDEPAESVQEIDELQEENAAEVAEEDAGESQTQIVESTSGTQIEEEALADVSMMTAEGEDGKEELDRDAAQGSTLEETAVTHTAGAETGHDVTETTEVTAETPEEQARQSKSFGVVDPEVPKNTAEAEEGNLKVSAENVSAAYGARGKPSKAPSGPLAHSLTSHPFRRSPSLPPTSSDVPVPAPNRLSILYADGTRRIVLDAPIVQAVQIHRRRGLIKVRIGGTKQVVHEKQVEHLAKKTEEMNVAVTSGESSKGVIKGDDETAKHEALSVENDDTKADEAAKPKSPLKGILLEALNEEANVFGLASSSAAADVDGTSNFPPLDQLNSESTEVIELTAFIDTAHRLSEPKWVKSGQLEDWISAIKTRETAGDAEENWRWRRKLEVADPEAPATLASVLETWAMKSKIGSLKERRRFLNTHMKDSNEFLNILLQAIRGDISPLSRSQIQHSHSLLKKTARPASVHYESQTYLTLAVMALVGLLKDYAAQTGEKASKLDDKIAEIIKSLPNPIIYSNTDKVFQDWYNAMPTHHKRKQGK
ncbi:hypothetical protein QFC21_004369 [Naganishia friedmannii]|uniref:Uncharacterized protein n=1 Tax=Naganishia friedmannii TaxID=89922 RepID=A0ACC2VHZ9_9TREE|nr:hypothetical protein QFC21_004369 [Naganishia friedmannii]